ncbi:MAG: sigma-70 family RNA polymerase sigma factor [Planctomycetes bacterium]|nr:sigma-70 family RNA polymerase sigma factor [Planctomycetota bacterium]
MEAPQEDACPPDRDAAAFARYLRRPTRRRLGRVVKLYHAHVWEAALRLTGSHQDAADLAQDLFLALLVHPPAPGTVTSPRGYLTCRVLDLARRRERSAERRRRREIEAARRLAAEGQEPELDLEAVHQAIAELPDRLRTAIELRYLAGCSNREVASLLGISERAVEERLQHGRERLRGALKPVAWGLLPLLGGEALPSAAAPPEILPRLLLALRVGGAIPARAASRPAGGRGATKLALGAAAAAAAVVAALLAWNAAFRPAAGPRAPIAAGPAPEAVEPAPVRGSAPAAPEEAGPAAAPLAAAPPAAAVRLSGWVVDEPPGPVQVEGEGHPAGTHVPKEGGGFAGEALEGKPLEGVVVWFQRSPERRPPVITGSVLDPWGRPAAAVVAILRHVEVKEMTGGLFSSSIAEEATGLDGRFAFEHDGLIGFKLDRYLKFPTRVVAAAPSRRLSGSAVIQREEEATDITIQLEEGPAGSVEGSVVDAGGSPVPGAGVIASHGDTLAGAHVGEDGRFALDGLLPDTFYTFVPQAGGHVGSPLRKLVGAGEATQVELVMPRRDAAFAGSVKDRSGRPVAGIAVQFTIEEAPRPSFQKAMTDAEGRFLVPELLPGRYLFIIEERGFGLLQDEVVLPHGPLEIELARTYEVRLRIELPSGEPVTNVRVKGKATPGTELWSRRGLYALAVPETETYLTVEFPGTAYAPVKLAVQGPPPAGGEVDLGTVTAAKAAE